MTKAFLTLLMLGSVAIGATHSNFVAGTVLVPGDIFVPYLYSETADAFPLARRGGLPDGLWTNAGVNLGAGIPTRETIYTNMDVGTTLAALNAALSACPSNEVVQITNGTFNFAGGEIDLSKDGGTLRGTVDANGLPATFFVDAHVKIGASSGWMLDATVTAINVSSGLTEGSTSIVLESSPSADFVVGYVMVIDQTDDGTNVLDCGLNWAHRSDRSYLQVVTVTGIDDTTITFQPPLLGTYWDAGLDPEAVGWAEQFGTTRKSGVENIDFDGEGAGQIVLIGASTDCWVKNCRFTDWNDTGGAAAIMMPFSVNCTVEDNIFHDGPTATSSSYAIYPRVASYHKIQNNLFTNVGLGMPMISAVGCVISYNVALGPYPYGTTNWLAEFFFPHGGHSHHCLYEGNWLPNIYLDTVSAGNNSYIGMVRNRLVGYAENKDSNLNPFVLEHDMDYVTALGNVLGHPGTHTTYPASIWDVDVSCIATITTNNWNVVSNGVPAGETLVGTMLDSYIYSSKPAFWGNLPWPWCSPVASLTNVLSWTNTRAGYRAYNGTNSP